MVALRLKVTIQSCHVHSCTSVPSSVQTRMLMMITGGSICHFAGDSASIFIEVKNGLVVFMEIKDDRKI